VETFDRLGQEPRLADAGLADEHRPALVACDKSEFVITSRKRPPTSRLATQHGGKGR
jgi:hypothetical protein